MPHVGFVSLQVNSLAAGLVNDFPQFESAVEVTLDLRDFADGKVVLLEQVLLHSTVSYQPYSRLAG